MAEERSQSQMELHTYELLQIHNDDDDDATTVMMRCRCPNSKIELTFRIHTFSTNVKRFKTLNDKLQHKSLVSRMEMHELLVRAQTWPMDMCTFDMCTHSCVHNVSCVCVVWDVSLNPIRTT